MQVKLKINESCFKLLKDIQFWSWINILEELVFLLISLHRSTNIIVIKTDLICLDISKPTNTIILDIGDVDEKERDFDHFK